MRTTVIVLILLTALLTGGCSKKETDAGTPGGGVAFKGNVSEAASVQARPGLVPAFSWRDSTGKAMSIDAFKGHVTLVNFWATWCAPCKKELPDLVALSGELAAKNVTIVGVATDRGMSIMDDVTTFVRDRGIPYQIVLSTDDLESAFGNVRLLPTSFVVNANGTIVKELVGIQTKDSFMQAITAAMQ
jgi:thiol-disulfide isomerase/thioredoxin